MRLLAILNIGLLVSAALMENQGKQHASNAAKKGTCQENVPILISKYPEILAPKTEITIVQASEGRDLKAVLKCALNVTLKDILLENVLLKQPMVKDLISVRGLMMVPLLGEILETLIKVVHHGNPVLVIHPMLAVKDLMQEEEITGEVPQQITVATTHIHHGMRELILTVLHIPLAANEIGNPLVIGTVVEAILVVTEDLLITPPLITKEVAAADIRKELVEVDGETLMRVMLVAGEYFKNIIMILMCGIDYKR
jgi:hypothetical protein